MSLEDMMRRIRDKSMSAERRAAREKQEAAGNAPWHTKLPPEVKADRTYGPLLGPEYRQAQQEKRKTLQETE